MASFSGLNLLADAAARRSYAEVCGGRPREEIRSGELALASAKLSQDLLLQQNVLLSMIEKAKKLKYLFNETALGAERNPSQHVRTPREFLKPSSAAPRIQVKRLLSRQRADKIYDKFYKPDGSKPFKVWKERSELTKRPAQPTSVKQVKKRAIISDVPMIGPLPMAQMLKAPRQARLGLICERLAKTECGAALAESLLVAWCRIRIAKDPSFEGRLRDTLTWLEQEKASKSQDQVQAQMEQQTDHGVDVVKQQDKSGSVVIEDQSVPSVNQPKIVRSYGLAPYSSAVEQQNFKTVSERWLRLKEIYSWSTEDKTDGLIARIVLPKAAIEANKDSPNAMPFLNHRYARCDMVVRIMINSNKFQVGQLQVNWMYQANNILYYTARSADERAERLYDNIWTASQRNHCIIDAGGSNDGIIRIPYWHVKSFMSCVQTAEDIANKNQPLDMGVLTIRVLAPLKTPDKVARTCNVSVAVAFENTMFAGLIDRGIRVQAQMEGLLNTAESLLHILNPPQDRDNPTMPDPARMLQPMAAHSLGPMTRQNEICRPMRADPSAQTSGVNIGDGTESHIQSLVRRWSLLKQFTWSNSDKAGTKLFSMPVSPVINSVNYESVEINGTAYYQMPILAVVSSLFGYFRGGIEVRLDVVASQFHTGRLQLSVVPGYQYSDIDMDQAKNSSSKIVDISLDRRVEFTCEFFYSVPWARINYGLDQPIRALAPSYFFVHVVNELVPMDNVAPDLTVNVYVRGAPDFELSIPRTCPISTPFSRITRSTKDAAYVKTGYGAMYVANSRQFPVGANYAASFFYNEVTDAFTQFDNFDTSHFYAVPTEFNIGSKKYYFRVQYYEGTELKDVKYIARPKSYGYPVAVLFKDEVSAKSFVISQNLTAAITTSAQGPWAQISEDNKTWRDITASELVQVPFYSTEVPQPKLFEDFELVEGQMDAQTGSNDKTVHTVRPPQITSFGRRTFGETIEDLRVYARRYQVLGCVSGTYSAKEGQCMNNLPPIATITLHPMKSMLATPRGRDNMVREGAISVIQSGFAGYRGSLRVKVIYTGTSDLVNFSLVHRFDNPMHFGVQSVRPQAKVISRPGDYLDSGYATEVQAVDVNPVMEVEVPFYRQGEFNLGYITTNRDIINNYSSLGDLEIYLTGASGRAKISDPVSYGFDVYYSVGDDFVFSNFQGFPPMLFLEQQNFDPVETVQGQMEYVRSFFSWPKSLCDLSSIMGSSVSKVSETAASALSSIKEAVTKMTDGTFLKAGMNGIASLGSMCKDFAYIVLSQIIQIINTPTQKTIITAIILILGWLFRDGFCELSQKLWDGLVRIWNYFRGTKTKKSEQQQSDVTEHVTANSDDEGMLAQVISLLWSVAGGLIGCCMKAPKSLWEFTAGLFKSSTEMFRAHLYGVKFFRDIFEFFQRIWRWINRKLGKKSQFYTLAKDDEALRSWFIQSELILENTDLVFTKRDWAQKAFECQVIGRLYRRAALNSKETLKTPLFNMVMDVYKKLTELVEKLIAKKFCGDLRMAPFVIWLSGPSGIGKTTFMQDLVNKLSVDFGLNGQYYLHTEGSKYYDGLDMQDFLVLDDFLACGGSDTLPEILGQFLQLSNDSNLSLPRADLPLKTRTDHFKCLIVTSNDDMVQSHISTVIRRAEPYQRRVHAYIKMTHGHIPEDDKRQDKGHLDYKGKNPKQTMSSNWNHVRFRMSTDCYVTSSLKKDFDDLYDSLKHEFSSFMLKAATDYVKRVRDLNKIIETRSTDSMTFEEYFKSIGKTVDLLDATTDVQDECKLLSAKLMEKYLRPMAEAQKTASEKVEQETQQTLITLESVKEALGKVKCTDGRYTDEDYKQIAMAMQMANSSGAPPVKAFSTVEGQMEKSSEGLVDFAPLGVEEALRKAVEQANQTIKNQSNSFVFMKPNPNVAGITCLAQSVSNQLKGSAAKFKNDPYAQEEVSTDKCYHQRIAATRMRVVPLASDTQAELSQIALEVVKPTTLFIDEHQLTKGAQSGIACYDAPCVIEGATGKAVDSGCIMVSKDAEICKRWFVFKAFQNVVSQLEQQGVNPVKFIQEGKLKEWLPEEWCESIIYPMLPKSDKVKPIHHRVLNRIVDTLSMGMIQNVIGIDGYAHVVDTNILRKTTVSKVVQPGLFYNTVIKQTCTDSGWIKTEQGWEPSMFLKMLCMLGICLAVVSYMCMFLDIIIWFIQFYKCFSWTSEGQIGTSGDIKMTKTSGAKVKAINLVTTDPEIEGEAYEVLDMKRDSNKNVIRKIANNIIFLCAVEEVNGERYLRRKARCLGIYNKVLLVQNHFIDTFVKLKQKFPSYVLGFKGPRSGMFLEWDFLKTPVQSYEEGGFCVMQLPKRVAIQFEDIRKYMPSAGVKHYAAKMQLIEPDIEGNYEVHHLENVRFSSCDDKRILAEASEEWDGWVISQRFDYNIGGSGMCGSFLMDFSQNTPLVGVHTAGNGAVRGVAEPIVREMFDFKKKEPVVEMVVPQLEVESMENVPDGPHIVIGHVPRTEGVIQQDQTKIEPSALFGQWPNSTEPAPLSPKDPRISGFRPLMEGVEKRCDPMTPFPERDLSVAVDDYRRKFLSVVSPTLARVAPLGWNEVVCGIQGVDFIDPMVLTTSEGYPWVKHRPSGFSDKRWMFDVDYTSYPVLRGMSKKLLDVLELHERMRARGVVPCSIYTACLKDARIAKEKIPLPGKTRVFEMSPVELTMAQRKYFLPVYSAYQVTRLDIEHTIGIAVNGVDWSELANRLRSFSPHILAGDFSSFGPKAELSVLFSVVDVHISWLKKYGYDLTSLQQCELLKYQILYAPHIIGRYLCKFIAGMPSGNAATVILNSGVNSIYMRLAWISIMRPYGLGSMDAFHKNVLLFSNGDDVIMAVKPDVVEMFNNESLARFFKQHNLNYTNSKKNEEIIRYEPLLDVQYLKCEFRPHPWRLGQWLARLDIKTVYETPLWVWKSKEDLKIRTAQNVDQALRLAYGHGPTDYNKFKTFLLNHCQDIDIYVPVPEWEDLDILVWEKGEDLVSWFWR